MILRSRRGYLPDEPYLQQEDFILQLQRRRVPVACKPWFSFQGSGCWRSRQASGIRSVMQQAITAASHGFHILQSPVPLSGQLEMTRSLQCSPSDAQHP